MGRRFPLVKVSISTALAILVSLLSVANASVQEASAFPQKRISGIVVAELAAKSSDDDDSADQKRAHSSSVKKSSDDDDSGKASSSKAAAKKKKKKPADEEGNDGPSKPEKKSSVSEGDAPSTKLKKPSKKDDDSTAPAKPKAADDKPAKEATDEAGAKNPKYAPNATVEPGAIVEFARQPERIQRLITSALDLTKLNLTYTYGSSEPSSGGMDCSGTIFYLLHSQGFQNVPRDSSGQYVWARKEGQFYAVVSTKADSFEFKDLQPGDLMFWSGTYQVERDIPVTHVMLYLGTEKRTGKRIMFGASDGRSYDGLQRWGVSVFDFKMPKSESSAPEKHRVDFVGYARIPGLREVAEAKSKSAAEAEEKPAEEAKAKNVIAKDADESTPAPKKKSATKKSTPRKHSADSDSQ